MENDDQEKIQEAYRKGFLDGFQTAKDNPYLTTPNVPLNTTCHVCMINFSSGVWGYVCGNTNCPRKISAL